MRALQTLVVAVLGVTAVGSRVAAAADGTAKIQIPHDAQEEEEAASDQRQRQQQQPTGHGGVSVQMAEQDGIRLEFVGQAEGTVPSPSDESSRQVVPPATGERSSVQLAGHDPVEGSEFQLLRCDGGSFAAGEDGSLTVKGVCDHMLGKLMQSAQQVCALCMYVETCKASVRFKRRN